MRDEKEEVTTTKGFIVRVIVVRAEQDDEGDIVFEDAFRHEGEYSCFVDNEETAREFFVKAANQLP